jgi:SAM-dependent methyltransferase
MTDDMLALARENQRKAGLPNVEFLKGQIEAIPLPDASVDVIISNCVINLSGDKDRVLAEAFRVLKPGGRFAVSDVVVRGSVPSEIRRSMELWIGCVAGALEEREYVQKLTAAGFVDAEVEATRIYKAEDARAFLAGAGLDADLIAPQIEGRFMGAFIRATKPVAIETCLLWQRMLRGPRVMIRTLGTGGRGGHPGAARGERTPTGDIEQRAIRFPGQP